MKPVTVNGAYMCRVYLAQARVRRHQPAFHAWLLNAAGNNRRRYAESLTKAAPAQGDLFGGTTV